MLIAIRTTLFALAFAACGLTAHAATWPALPVACTPERAAPWQEGKSELQQPACHCPPTSMCPTTYEEYSDASKSKLPLRFIARCCPVIEPEKCPAGTQLAGQPMPDDRQCNPYCPVGSLHQGQRLVDVGGEQNCNKCLTGNLAGQDPINGLCNVCTSGSLINQPIPDDGDCNPQYCPTGTDRAGQRITPGLECDEVCPAGTTYAGQSKRTLPGRECTVNVQCPAKYYPTMNQANAGNIPDPFHAYNAMKPGNKQVSETRYKYTYPSGETYTFYQYDSSSWDSRRLRDRQNWSLRITSLGGWAPQRINGKNPIGKLYAPSTGGIIQKAMTLPEVFRDYGPDRLTWFGYFVAGVDYLGENYASDAVIGAMGGREYIQLASGGKKLSGYNALTGKGVDGFLSQCADAYAEYAELVYVNHQGRQCPYLQCRYIDENTGDSCLSGDTPITLADGSTKAVKDLKLGDLVKGAEGDHKITAANTYQSGLRVLYGINGSDAMLTGDHPIRTTDGWKVITEDAAKLYASTPGFAKTKLEVGDVLVTEKGEVRVESITRFPKVDPVSTYNIKVEGNHGFFANGIEVKGFNKMEMHYE